MHPPLGAVELDARVLERQTAVLEQASHAALEIGQHILVLHAQHATRQGMVEMVHELDIGAVIAADVFEVVGEGVPVGVELLEVAEAAVHRIAARVDDPGIGQDQLDQRDVAEVVRHLVDEVRFAGAAVGLGIADVGLAERPALIGGQVRQHAGVVGVTELVAAAQRPDEARDVGEFHRALDLRVRGEDLLEQRRACARQTQHEDGRGIGASPAAPRGEELRRADVHLAPYGPFLGRRTVHPVLFFEGVAAGVIGERLAMLAAVFERLPEREAEVIAVGVLQLRLRLVVPHPLEFGLCEAIGLHVGEAPIRLTEIGSELDRPAVGGDGLCGLAVGLVGVSQRLVELGVARHLLQQRPIALDGTRDIAQGHHDPGMGHPHARIGRLGGHQSLGLRACAWVFVQIDEREHEVVARRVVVRCLRQQLVEQHLGVGVVLEVPRDHGEHAQRLHIVGMLGEVRADGALGVLEITVGDHGARGDHRLRQRGEFRDMAGRVRSVFGPADDPIELLERLPAGGQGGVVADGPLEGFEGFRGIALRDMAVTALLEQP